MFTFLLILPLDLVPSMSHLNQFYCFANRTKWSSQKENAKFKKNENMLKLSLWVSSSIGLKKSCKHYVVGSCPASADWNDENCQKLQMKVWSYYNIETFIQSLTRFFFFLSGFGINASSLSSSSVGWTYLTSLDEINIHRANDMYGPTLDITLATTIVMTIWMPKTA